MAETGSAQAGAGGGAGEAPQGVRATGFLQRAVLRRRLRFLARRRELALHDLGGFVFESHRLGEARPELQTEKLAAIDAIDAELVTLQHALDVREELAVLHEPGISSCPHCGTIHDSAANYCPGCGRARAAGHGSPNGAGPKDAVSPPPQAAPAGPPADAPAPAPAPAAVPSVPGEPPAAEPPAAEPAAGEGSP